MKPQARALREGSGGEAEGVRPTATRDEAAAPSGSSGFILLDDQPYPREHDPLGFEQIARDLANLIRASRASTPLALGIESGWGMGKSTLMRRLERALAEDSQIATVWFNAWTADQGHALEGLVKSVLAKLDRNILRRAARNEKLLSWAKVVALVLADWLKIGSLVNTIWREVSVDPKARNDMHELVVKSMREWVDARTELGPGRLLVVFVDDLDRCPPVNVLQVFEAIKLYLDAPGLVFVIGYDRDVVSDAILDIKQYSDSITSHHYLEKIIQLVYRLPSVSDEGANKLLDVYLENSATKELFDSSARSLTLDQNARNPRRIKRFINGFILEYGLDPEWEQIGPEMLVRVLIVDVYFPEFGNLLRSRAERDPVRDFREYVAVRDILRRRSSQNTEDRQRLTAFLESYGLAPPDGPVNDQQLLEEIEREIPSGFPKLAQNPDFLTLLDGFPDVKRVREKLRRLSTSRVQESIRSRGIFLSYVRSDSAFHAMRLRDELNRHFGVEQLFMDVENLSPGVDFFTIVEKAMRSASVVLVIIGSQWKGRWLEDSESLVRRELAIALTSPGIRAIPILVDGAEMPRMSDLPGELVSLARRNAVRLSDDRWQEDVQRLIDALEYLLTQPSVVESSVESS
jgi:hypothetical protein